MTADGVKRTRILRKIGGLLIVGAAAWWTAVSSCLAGGTEEIYVIGSRDDYPMEYYNEDTGEFEGIMPDMLELISQKSGIRFSYLTSSEDKEDLAKNLQGEIVSDVNSLQAEEMELSGMVYAFETGEKAEEDRMGFAFTTVASDELKEQFTKAAESVTPGEKEQILYRYVRKSEKPDLRRFIPLFLLCPALALALVLTAVKGRHRRKLAEKQGERLKYMDPETGVSSFWQLNKDYARRTDENARALFCVGNLCIENMSRYRELFGMRECRKCAREIAGILDSFIKEKEMYASDGTGEFYLLLRYPSENEALEKVEEIVEKIRYTFSHHGIKYPFIFRWGICHLGIEDYSLEQPAHKALLARLYAGKYKKEGALYDDALGREMEKEHKIEEEVLSAFQNNRFVPYYQPSIDLDTGRITGAEALTRWENRQYGLLFPNSFIPVLEKNRMISKLDLLIFEQVCGMLKERIAQSLPLITISCNFSRYSFEDQILPEKLLKICSEYQVPAQLLEIEITESVLEENEEQILKVIARLKQYGFLIALDDFGTGYASLRNLETYMIDHLKLDRSVIMDIGNKKTDVVLKGIIDLAHSLHTKVVCEGIESEKMLETLKDMGCDIGQGHYFYQPLPIREFERLYDGK